MFGFIISAVKIIFLLGFLIFIHETGHFLVAKWCKVRVNEFAIGFGPTIWKKQGKETKYALRLIPLGGFVSMEGEEERSEEKGSFSQASIPKRIAIVAAGATVNIVFGLFVYFGIMMAEDTNITNRVEELLPGYAAETVGIQQGDEIQKINGKAIRLKTDIDKIISESNGEELEITLKRGEEVKNIKVIPTKEVVKTTGIYLSAMNKEEKATEIVSLEKESPAEKAGLQVGDIITKINDIEVLGDTQKVVEVINSQESSEKLRITVKRNQEVIEAELVPIEMPVYYLGITFAKAESTIGNRFYYGFWNTIEFSGSIIENVKMLVSGKVGVEQMMGPVGISSVVSNTKGVKEFLSMMALISLSLGVTNLLPIPALDGGKIVILFVEAIRRKPLKQEVELTIQMLGFAFIIGLSIFITYQDILRIF